MTTRTLVHNEPAGVDLRWLSFDAPIDGHTLPGQFVVAQPTPDAKAFFALANVPGANAELLVKRQGPAGTAVADLVPGASLALSPAQGRGFGAIDPDRRLVILAAGSGISAVRPLVEMEISDDVKRPVHLYYGVLSPDHVAFARRLDAWRAAGVDVHVVVNPADGTRFVQHAARDDGHAGPDVELILVGFPGMVAEAREIWTAAGLPPDRVRTNF